MSSLVNKQLQVAAEDKNKVEKTPQQSMTKKSIPTNKGLTRRSMSFEKFLVTAFHIRLACTKCSRESLKLCLEMLILRSRIIAQHSITAVNLLLANLVQLSHEWNSTLLEIVNVIIPKWQASLQRQWLRQQEKRTTAETKAETLAKPVDVKQDVIEEEVEESADDRLQSEVVGNSRLGSVVQRGLERTMEERATIGLTLAVIACVIFLAVQICLGMVLLIQQGIPVGMLFLVACVAYIAYLLKTICDFTQSNTTTCKFGKTSNTTTHRQVLKSATTNQEKESGLLVTETVKVIQLSFLEKTISKVKLL